MRSNFDTSTKIAGHPAADPARQSRHRLHRPAQRPDRRRHASTDASASPSGSAEGGMLVTVVGQPQGLDLEGTRRLSDAGDFSAADAGTCGMPLPQDYPNARSEQSIDHARRRDKLRSTTRWRAPARRWPGCARATPTARCRCCACRNRRDDIADHPRLRRAAARRRHRRGVPRHRRLEPRRPDAGAARRLRACPASARLRDRAAHAFHGQSRSRDSYGALLERLPLADHALRRDLEVRRHRRDADADHRRARRASRRPGLERASANCSSASPSRPSPASQRPARSASAPSDPDAGSRSRRRRPLFGADQCRPAAGRGLRPRHRRDPRRRRRWRWRRCSPASRRPRCRPRVGAALASRRCAPARPSRC